MIALNLGTQQTLASRVSKADDFASRSRGLLGVDKMEEGSALWIEPCAMIHTVFMRFSIDVLFLDRELKVRKVIEDLKPFRLSPWVWGARSVLEFPAGALKGRVSVGDRISIA